MLESLDDSGMKRLCRLGLVAAAATMPLGMAWAQQTATATGSCGVAINASGQAQVTVNNNCDAKTAAAVQKLVNQTARQDRQIKELSGSLRSMTGDLDALQREVKGLTAAVTTVQEAAARPSATPADRRADELLASGDASAAAELLGRKASGAGREAPALFRQQSALLSITDSSAALAALERALTLEPGDFETLWRAGDLALAAGQLDKASQYYERMRDAASVQLQRRPTAETVNQVAMSFIKMGDIKLAKGDTTAALSYYGAGTDIALKRVQTGSNNSESLRILSYALRQSGAAQRAVPDVKRAIKSYQDALVFARMLVGRDDRNADAWMDLLATYLSLADLQRIDGDLRAARDNQQAATLIAQELLKIDGNNVNWLNAASACYSGQAAIDQARNDLPAALSSFQAGLAISQRLAQADPGNFAWKHNLLAAYLGAGDVFLAQQKPADALRSYLSALSVARAAARMSSSHRQALSDHAAVWMKLSDVHMRQGDLEAALKDFQAVLPLVQQLVQMDPANQAWRSFESAVRTSLGSAYFLVADQQRNKAEPTSALKNYQLGMAQIEVVMEAQGRKPEHQLALAEFAWKIATLEGTSMPQAERSAMMNKGLDIVLNLQRLGQLPPAQAAYPNLFRQALARLQ